MLQVAHDCDLALLEAILNRHDLYTGQVKGVLHLFLFHAFLQFSMGFDCRCATRDILTFYDDL